MGERELRGGRVAVEQGVVTRRRLKRWEEGQEEEEEEEEEERRRRRRRPACANGPLSSFYNENYQVFDPLKLFLKKRVFRTMFLLCGNTESTPNYVVCVLFVGLFGCFLFCVTCHTFAAMCPVDGR